MADPPASERAYRRLKSDIMSGALASGSLDIGLLSDRMKMSVTPVREALARLSAERLVKLAPHLGYMVASPSARRLENLYDLTGALLHLCLQRANRSRPAGEEHAGALPLTGSYAADISALLSDVASRQPNGALSETIVALGDQLYSARRCEPRLFPDTERELAELVALWKSRNLRDLRLRLRAYHRIRVVRVDAIARLVSEAAGES